VHPTRRARIQSVIQDELSVVIPAEVKDPRVSDILITGVEMSPDGSHAIVNFTFDEEGPDDKQKAKTCLEGLISAKGFLRAHMASILNTKYVPDLVFKFDKGYWNAQKVEQILKKI
jgi:ribosome-binding factor A